MYKTVLLLLIALAAAPSSWSQSPTAMDYFGNAKFRSMKISPDGNHLAFTYEDGDELKLGVLRRKDNQIVSRFSFGEQMHVVWFDWANHERVLMQVSKVTGNLDTHFGRRAQLHGANIDGQQRRRMDEDVRGFSILNSLANDPKHLLIAKGTRGGVRAYSFDVYTGKTTRVPNQPEDPVNFLMADQKGIVRLAGYVDEDDGYSELNYKFYVRKNNEWSRFDFPIARKDAQISPAGFSSDGRTAYFLTNHDDRERGIVGMYAFNYDDDSFKLVYRHPESDIRDVIHARDGSVIGLMTMAGYPEVTWLNTANDDTVILRGFMESLPNTTIRMASTTTDTQLTVIHVSSDRKPGSFYLYDSVSGRAQQLADVKPTLAETDLLPMKPFVVTARDGMVLHGYLTLAAGSTGKRPTIVIVHGGPFGIADNWGFHPEAQYFARHGYHVLQVNYRGSGGYGTEFEKAGWREYLGKMQDDVTDATNWAVAQGIADASRLCIYGGSYGGFATLGGLVKEPDLYKCGVAYVGVYDLLYKASGAGTDTRQHMRGSFSDYVREQIGPDEAFIRARSPLHQIEKLKAPIFIVAAENDVRVPIEHAYRLREALSERQLPFEWLSKAGEGHGYQKVENRVELYERMLKFFNQHIGADKAAEAR